MTSSIVGHARVLSLLQSSLEKGTLSHAYLFVGPPHVGKMTVALWLAQALNCEASERPCARCTHCQKIAAGNHSDVQTIRLLTNGSSSTADKPPTEISIEQIEDMQHVASLPPFEGRHKVFIIDGAEQMSTDASNRLLKTLEEPVGKVVFILLTTADRLLLPTVVSRCQRLDLVPLSRTEVETALCARGVDAGKAALLARVCRGCAGWAFAAVDNSSLLAQRQQEMGLITDIIRARYEERFAYAAQLATQFARNRESVQDVLALWADWWRDLLLTKAGCSDSITNIDREDSLVEISRAYSLEQVRTYLGMLLSAAVQLRQNANARLVLEVLMLNIPEIKNG